MNNAPTVLIISESKDVSTVKVMEWLKFYEVECLRVNDGDEIEISVDINEDKITVTHNDIDYDLSIFREIWYRRGWISLKLEAVEVDGSIANSILRYCKLDINQLQNYFYNNLFENSLGNIVSGSINKNVVLQVAKKNGLLIPPTLITRRKSDLINFIKTHGIVITKTINEQVMIIREFARVLMYTELLKDSFIESLPEEFGYSLFQKCIDKQFEIRTFFIEDSFYSMAIFSQDDPQTTIDFRKYNYEQPNRVTNFKLPEDIEKKLLATMKAINLNTGSIDIIKGKDNNYYFLEVNPIGQFGMVSYPCNYNLERKIASWLIRHEKKDFHQQNF